MFTLKHLVTVVTLLSVVACSLFAAAPIALSPSACVGAIGTTSVRVVVRGLADLDKVGAETKSLSIEEIENAKDIVLELVQRYLDPTEKKAIDLSGLENLTLLKCGGLDGASGAQLHRITKLKSLELNGCPGLDEQFFQDCKEFSTLTRLAVVACQEVTGEFLAKVRLDSLEQLVLEQSRELSAHVLEYVAKCANLTLLSLKDSSSDAVDPSDGFSTVPKLSSIFLNGCNWIDEDVVTSIAAAPALRVLSLSDCAQVYVAVITGLKGHKTLSTLDLSNTRVGSGVGDLIATLPALRKLSLRSTEAVEADFEAMEECPELSELDVRACEGVTPKGLKSIIKIKELSRLDLSYCTSIKNEDLLAISDGSKLSFLAITGVECDERTLQQVSEHMVMVRKGSVERKDER